MRALATASRSLLWALGMTLSVLLLSSLAGLPLTAVQACALGLFAALALVRPVDALLLFAALGPLVPVIAVLFRVPMNGTRLLETFVLLLVVPWMLVQGRWIRSAQWRPIDWAVLAFGTIVAASVWAHLPALALQSGTESVWRQLLADLRVHLQNPPGVDLISTAALLLEGLVLAAMVGRCARDGRIARRIAEMTVAGATGAALLNIYRLFEVALRRGPLTETLADTFSSLRINIHFGDVNAAGSYFAMALVAAAGIGDTRSPRGLACLLCVPPLAVAVWLSGSRIALGAAVLGMIAAFLLRHRERATVEFRSRKRLLAVLVAGLALVTAVTILPKARSATVRYSVFARVELAATAFRMLEDRPVFGIGVSRFYQLFPQYASPALREAFSQAALIPVTHENAHNYFLQILAELGTIGFTAFALLLWLALRFNTRAADSAGARVPLLVAVCTFLVTSLFGHPLLVHNVAYPFWIVLGLSAAAAPDPKGRWTAGLRRAMGGILVLTIASAPIRAGYERRHANLAGVALGLSAWQRDEAGNQFRWAGERSTLFVDSHLRLVRLPLRAAVASGTCTVEIRMDGRPVDRVTVPSAFWHDVRVRMPPATDLRRFRRIDLLSESGCGRSDPDGEPALMVGRHTDIAAPSGSSRLKHGLPPGR